MHAHIVVMSFRAWVQALRRKIVRTNADESQVQVYFGFVVTLFFC